MPARASHDIALKWQPAYGTSALPEVCRYPDNAWEVLYGYEQQRRLSMRSGAALLELIQATEAQPGKFA